MSLRVTTQTMCAMTSWSVMIQGYLLWTCTRQGRRVSLFQWRENGGLHHARGVVLLRMLGFICHTQPRTCILKNALGPKTRDAITVLFIIGTFATHQGRKRQ
jgi:hypothetical protein